MDDVEKEEKAAKAGDEVKEEKKDEKRVKHASVEEQKPLVGECPKGKRRRVR